MAAVLKALKLAGSSLLVTIPGHDVNVYKSIRNIADVSVLPVAELNAWEVLQSEAVADDHRRVGRDPRETGEEISVKPRPAVAERL